MKVVKGKGKKYSAVANEVRDNFHEWLNYNHTTAADFDHMLSGKPLSIFVKESENSISVSIMAGNDSIMCPFIWNSTCGVDKQSFWADLMLMLYYIASRNNDKNNFLPVVDDFVKTNKIKFA